MKTIALIALFILSSCAQMQENYIKHHCNPEAAFENGFNDAKNGAEMQGSAQTAKCEGVDRKALMASYREGYLSYKAPPTLFIKSHPGNRECKNGVCGYNCVEAYSQTKCARTPMGHCHTDFGKITCGINCRPEYGTLKCDQYDR